MKELSYEKAAQELEEVVEKLAAGRISLDEMMCLYERGKALSKHCQSLLDAYEKRLEIVEEGEQA